MAGGPDKFDYAKWAEEEAAREAAAAAEMAKFAMPGEVRLWGGAAGRRLCRDLANAPPPPFSLQSACA